MFEITVNVRRIGLPSFALMLALCCCRPCAGLQAEAPKGEKIPEVHGTSLAGDAVSLPADLHGKLGVLVIGFSKGSRGAATTWARRLGTEFHDSDEVASYELPMLAGVPGFLRGMVVRSMKSDVSERGQHTFVPVTTDEDRWKSLVHFGRPDDAYLLIVDSSGRVRWTTSGEPTEEAYAALRREIASLGATKAR